MIIGHDSDQSGGQLYHCGLSLDDKLNTHFQNVVVMPRSELNHKQDVQGEFILLANELFSEKELQSIFGYPPSSWGIAPYSKAPKADGVLAVYDFTRHLMHQQDSSDLIHGTERRV